MRIALTAIYTNDDVRARMTHHSHAGAADFHEVTFSLLDSWAARTSGAVVASVDGVHAPAISCKSKGYMKLYIHGFVEMYIRNMGVGRSRTRTIM